jgi:DNA gyrase subunit A
VLPFTDETDIVLFSDHGRALIVHTSVIPAKTSRSTQGVFCMKFGRGKHMVTDAALLKDTDIKNVSRYRSRTIPAMGALIKEEDRGEEQMSLLD